MHAQTQEIELAIARLGQREKLHLIEVLAQSLQYADDRTATTDRKANLDRLQKELGRLPIGNPQDGLSNRDHDALLYGGAR